MDFQIPLHPAMQLSPIVRQYIDVRGRLCGERENGDVCYDLRPYHLTFFVIFDNYPYLEQWLDEQIESKVNQEFYFNYFESCHFQDFNSLIYPILDAPEEAVPDKINASSGSEFDFDFDFDNFEFHCNCPNPNVVNPLRLGAKSSADAMFIYGLYDGLPRSTIAFTLEEEKNLAFELDPFAGLLDDLLPAAQIPTVQVPRNHDPIMQHQPVGSAALTTFRLVSYAPRGSQEFGPRVSTARPKAMPYVSPVLHQSTRPVLSNVRPMIQRRQAALPLSVLRASTAPTSVHQVARPVFANARPVFQGHRPPPPLCMLPVRTDPASVPQFARPAFTNAHPTFQRRQFASPPLVQPVRTALVSVASVAQPVPDLFTSPYPKPTPQHLKGFRPGFDQWAEKKAGIFGYEKVPLELTLRILKYTFTVGRPLVVQANGQIESGYADIRSLLFLSHATSKAYPGLFYCQNTFECLHAKSMINLLRQPSIVTDHVFHLDVAAELISKARMDEICRLLGLKTLRITGVERPGYCTGYNPNIRYDATPAQRLQEIEVAVRTTLNKKAVRSKQDTARFLADQTAVRKMKKKGVEITFAARYGVRSAVSPYRTNRYKTVYEIKLVGGQNGYGLERRSDKIL